MAATLISSSEDFQEDVNEKITCEKKFNDEKGIVKTCREKEKSQVLYKRNSNDGASCKESGVTDNVRATYCDFCSKGKSCATAVLKCKECKMVLCSACDSKLHAKIQGHLHQREKLLCCDSSKMHGSGGPGPHQDQRKSFLLLDDNEKLKVSNVEDFIHKLNCDKDSLVKVVSIFGNTGDGKSHTLNYTFFSGEEIFSTSESHISCTIGVWCYYCKEQQAILLDTEGLLGTASNHNQRTRLLLKVFAISDVIIYRTRAERLHSDMFTFLGDASEAYLKHFTKELQAVSQRCCLEIPICNLGPSVVIFHETVHTNTLDASTEEQNSKNGKSIAKTAEDVLRDRFSDVGRIPQAFSSIRYVGTRTKAPPTNFTLLAEVVMNLLKDTSVRSTRTPHVIHQSLLSLNEKFSGDIETSVPSAFPDHYFTCMAKCMSCNTRCQCSMNHERDNISHQSDTRCHYQAQFDNRIFLCKVCFHRGKCNAVMHKTCASTDNSWFSVAKYAWSGSVLECKDCGVIYRSRQYWYGNKDPVEGAVQVEIVHVWPGSKLDPRDTSNAARRVLDGVNMVAGVLGNISAKPSQVMSDWVADSIAPSYWVPNNKIIECSGCKEFKKNMKKHHCRACGGGFCDNCSSKRKPVPERGWGTTPVRVCDACFDNGTLEEQDVDLCEFLEELEESEKTEEGVQNDSLIEIKTNEGIPSVPPCLPVTARTVGETVHAAVGKVKTVFDYPKEFVTDAARPVYWVPDTELVECSVCKEEFGQLLSKHHCRACGHGVCNSCSKHRMPVPSQGWDHDVRVCNTCAKTDKL